MGVHDPEPPRQDVDRHHDHDGREHVGAEDETRDAFPPGKPEARQAVGADGAHGHGEEHGEAGHADAVDEVAHEGRLAEQTRVVLEGGRGWDERGRRGQDLAGRLQRGREHPEERQDGLGSQPRRAQIEKSQAEPSPQAPHVTSSSRQKRRK